MKKIDKDFTLMRFISKVIVPKNPDECMLWKGAHTGKGHSQFWYGKKLVLAHRWSYEFFNHKKIEKGMTVDHQCNVPACVNPRHLKEMTLLENIARATKGACYLHKIKTRCIRGHEFTKENTKPRKVGRQCRICFNKSQRDYYQKRKSNQALQSWGKE